MRLEIATYNVDRFQLFQPRRAGETNAVARRNVSNYSSLGGLVRQAHTGYSSYSFLFPTIPASEGW